MSNAWNRAVRSSGLWRFVSVGVGDARRSLARLTAEVPVDETGVPEVFASSATLGAVVAGIGNLRAAARSSVLVAAATALATAWREQSPAARAQSSGIALLTSAGTYVGLSLWRQPVAGWLWLVVPVLAASFGALLTLAPGRGPSANTRP